MKKIISIICAAVLILCSFGLMACKDDEENSNTVTPCEKHDWEFVSTTANCITNGTSTYKCKACGEQKELNDYANGKHSFVNNKCEYCKSPTQPIEIVEIACVRSSSSYVRISGKVKNVSPLAIQRIRYYCFLVAVENGERVVVAQNDGYIVTFGEYMQPNSTLEFSKLIKCSTSTIYTQYSINIQAPTFEEYVMRYEV